jgi:hypothetical protein
MLKVALDKGSRGNDDFYDPNPQTLVRLRSRVQFPPEACPQISLEAFKIKVLEESHSKKHPKSLDAFCSIFSKNIYLN